MLGRPRGRRTNLSQRWASRAPRALRWREVGDYMLQLTQIEKPARTAVLRAQLTAVWESAVRATHDFLNEADIQGFKAQLPEFLLAVEVLVVAFEDGAPLGFAGVNGSELDMLFVAADARGRGVGRALVGDAQVNHRACQLTVNEENPQALGFYRHLGFEVYERSELDDQGNPFPILRMRTSAASSECGR